MFDAGARSPAPRPAMTPERHHRLEELCHAALDREPAARAAFLADVCAEDEALRQEAEELLAHADDAARFIESPALELAAAAIARGPQPAGRQVGPYTLLSLLGSGGMGDVYRARDTLLNRDVAIKLLPPLTGSDAGSRARVEREAHLLAALNHPHIAAIYELEHLDGMPALVLELVEGDTLAERVAAGPLSLRDSMAIARQIVDALEAAHEKGIVHRDLKPANIKVTPDGTVKVLDFGVAKALTDSSRTNTRAGEEPTLTGARAPVILGTAAYMSPEQAQGAAVDKRTDIWAFACVLYEMLTGTRAFGGTTVVETMASVVAKEPDWRALPADTPSAIRRLLRRCLAKERRNRLADIADARLELAEALSPEPPPFQERAPRAWLRWTIVASGLVAVAVALFYQMRQGPPISQPARLQIILPEAAGRDTPVFLSPDGRTLALLVRSAGAPASRLWIYSLASGRWQQMSEAVAPTGSSIVFWSPDSRSIGFLADGKLRKVDVASGAIQPIADVERMFGGTWTHDGLIAFTTPGGLKRVSAAGGIAVPLTVVDQSRRETGHFYPRFLPDGRHFIYLRASTEPDLTGLYVGSIDVSPEEQDLTRVLATQTNVEYVRSGTNPALDYLLFVRDGTLIAQTFNVTRRQVAGDPIPIAEQVGERDAPFGRLAYFSVSQTGVLAYRQREVISGTPVWVDRTGRELAAIVDTPLERLSHVRLSPEGHRLAAVVSGDLWVYDLTGRPPIKLTFDGGNDMPFWTPDGQRVVYAAKVPRMGLLSVAAVQGGTPELISPVGHYHPHAWAPDGTLIAVRNSYSPMWWDILRLRPKGANPEPLLQTSRNEGEGGAALSPDGRWLAYTFNATGRDEIWVAPYPGLGAPVRVSANGGADPVWAKNGRELYYLEGQKVMSVAVQTTAAAPFGRATMLFESPTTSPLTQNASYDVAMNGRFLMVKTAAPHASAPPAQIVLNWVAGMSK